jgi:23S rRNA pseudouridine1911/1915/1917 synthase
MCMKNQKKQFKRPPKRFEPPGLSILYEDWDILVADKAGGLLTVSTEAGAREKTAYYLLNEYVRKGNQKSKRRVFIVHRLDKDTSGVIVFAKSERAKRFLQDEWHTFKKTYYALVHGSLPHKKGVITSYLAENSVFKMYSVADPKKGALAKTGYTVKKESAAYSLVEIDLLTGRKNQIRVHLADTGCPVVGDRKYGKKHRGSRPLALHAATLVLRHPVTQEQMSFEAPLPAYFNTLIR